MEPAVTLPSIDISARAAAQIRAGSFWIFSNEIRSKPSAAKKGAWCRFTSQNKPIGIGYFNPHSLIAGRVVSLNAEANITQVLSDRLKASFRRRRGIAPLSSARLVFGESDLLPGLVIDLYHGDGNVLVLQSNTAGIDEILPVLTGLVPSVFQQIFEQKVSALVIKADAGVRQLEGVENFTKVIQGDEAALKQGRFIDNGVWFAADFISGQKTGFFLDQRDNRAALDAYIRKNNAKTLLDLCCYSGGWGLSALKAGVDHVTFVDASVDALNLVKRGLELNKIPAARASFEVSDVFDYLEKDTGAYDIVVADPPAFVKSKKNVPQGIKGYEKLNRQAWRRVKDNGLLMTCSCSYHISDADFMNVLHGAVAKENGLARLVYRGTQSADHPILLSMPETHYLKCVGLEKIAQ